MEPYMHELSMALAERTIKRLWILVILLIVVTVGSNLGWLYYESQFEDSVVTQEITQSLNSDKGDAIINDGVHINE